MSRSKNLASLLLFSTLLLGAAWPPPPSTCSGCDAIDHGESNTSTCISITNDNFTITTGTCTAQCSSTPCQLDGGYTVTNNCTNAIYIRTVTNAGCVIGTVEVQSGKSHDISYDNHSLICGERVWVRVYESDPGDPCPATADASWSFECTACNVGNT